MKNQKLIDALTLILELAEAGMLDANYIEGDAALEEELNKQNEAYKVVSRHLQDLKKCETHTST